MVLANAVVFACPVHCWPEMNFKHHVIPVMHSVKMTSLCHIYLPVQNGHCVEPLHIMDKTGLLGQVVSMSPSLLMVYVSNSLADYHNNMHIHHPKKWMKQLLHSLRNVDESLTNVEFESKNVKVCYWEKAISYWRPNAIGQPLTNLAVVPHCSKVPNFAVVGEQFSSLFQGWAEGALETADIAVQYLQNSKENLSDLLGQCIIDKRDYEPHKKEFAKAGLILYDGRILNVQHWISKHPGGAKAIENHLQDKDIKTLFASIHRNSPYAYALLLSLQEGILYK